MKGLMDNCMVREKLVNHLKERAEAAKMRLWIRRPLLTSPSFCRLYIFLFYCGNYFDNNGCVILTLRTNFWVFNYKFICFHSYLKDCNLSALQVLDHSLQIQILGMIYLFYKWDALVYMRTYIKFQGTLWDSLHPSTPKLINFKVSLGMDVNKLQCIPWDVSVH